MLLIENLDKPGFIGSLGRTLGDGRINIAAFHNGRLAPGERAFCLVSVDQKIDESLLRRIGSLPNVVSVRDLTF
jgi:D-3-phosphoglycerate dehydrogenase